MDDDENTEKWYGEKNHITASEERVLITHLVGNAYRKLCESCNDNFRWRLFERNGCLIAADGSDDAKVIPKGLSNYELQPPIDIDLSATPATSSTVPSLEPNVDKEDDRNDFNGENEHDNVEIVRYNDIPNDDWIFDLFGM